jgi:xanthine dehydrogenase accessory factor
MMVRRLVSLGEAVYTGRFTVEDITGVLAESEYEIQELLNSGFVPVLVDPKANVHRYLRPIALIDARMTKQKSSLGMDAAPIVIGLGPGFTAGKDCHAVVETNRGHFLGRVIWQGQAEVNTGVPGSVAGRTVERVLRAPTDGVLNAYVKIGSQVDAGQTILDVNGTPLKAPFKGVLRGLLHPDVKVKKGMKIGDLDPRGEPNLARLVSEKSLAIGGGVLEALLTRPTIRTRLWE